LESADFFIVTVPTPVDKAKRPDTSYLQSASAIIGRAMRSNSRRCTVVFESTVYPGCTEELCVPILERSSGRKAQQDFDVGYSPERMNPGDSDHTLETVVKVVAAQSPEALERIVKVYGLVVKAGIHRAPDIRTAEAAKVIENVQRDLNIAFVNELSMLFHHLGINFRDVLKAAKTKWNFLPFEPGLVGGHCIPEDPYYLTFKAQEAGFYPEIILAGRRINDSMGIHVARETIKLLISAGRVVKDSRVLVLGLAFKENVRDVRNTRVVDLVNTLKEHQIQVFVDDPLVDDQAFHQLGLQLAREPFTAGERYDAVVLAVPHAVYRQRPVKAYLDLLAPCERKVFVDVKGCFLNHEMGENVLYWSL
jgi:UDP-N-acetyl-D-galactosamine dehydrogenase